jgi:small subunit ribosomal protein S5
MAGLESLRTPEEVAELRGLSVNAVLGLSERREPETDSLSSDTAVGNGNGSGDGTTRVSVDSESPSDTSAAPSAAGEQESGASA